MCVLLYWSALVISFRLISVFLPGGDSFKAGGHGGGEQESRLTGSLGFSFEREAQLLEQVHVAGSVVRTSTSGNRPH